MNPSQFRLVRIAGLGVCSTLLLLRCILLSQKGELTNELLHARWLPELIVFCVALCLNTTARPISQTFRFFLLAIQSVSVLAMTFAMGGMHANNYLGFLMLVVSWQLAIMLPMRVALFWIFGQTIGLSLGYVLADHSTVDWTTGVISIIFKSFMNVVILVIKRESDARAAYAAMHAEMLATQDLLAERSAAHERLRISRDLHDVLGHHLTALSLNLEIATNRPGAPPPEEVLNSQRITKDLLQEVRDVVTALRSAESVNLRDELRDIASRVGPIAVHLSVPERLRSCDPKRAEVVIRCVQELITNSIKHANAGNIWIDLRLDSEDMLTIQSRDDGGKASIAEPQAGFGLTSMRERFELFGGKVNVLTDPHEGFSLSAFLPMLPLRTGEPA